MTEPKPEPTAEPVTGDEARAVLAALWRASNAVLRHEDSRNSADHDGKWERWKRACRKALAMGAQIEGGRG